MPALEKLMKSSNLIVFMTIAFCWVSSPLVAVGGERLFLRQRRTLGLLHPGTWKFMTQRLQAKHYRLSVKPTKEGNPFQPGLGMIRGTWAQCGPYKMRKARYWERAGLIMMILQPNVSRCMFHSRRIWINQSSPQ